MTNPADAGARRERRDAMKVTAGEKDDLDREDVSRPYQRKICKTCGKKFRTCSGGRLNCITCVPATYHRRKFRIDPALKLVKEVTREGKRKVGGDVLELPAPPEEVLAAQVELSEKHLTPTCTEEAVAMLARIMEHVARGRISVLRGRALSAIVRMQIQVLQKKETMAFKEREKKERDHRRKLSEAKRALDLEKKKAAKEEERRRLKNSGGKPGHEVPLPQLTEDDVRLAEGGLHPNDAGDGTEKEIV